MRHEMTDIYAGGVATTCHRRKNLDIDIHTKMPRSALRLTKHLFLQDARTIDCTNWCFQSSVSEVYEVAV
jgi:hypothetical protein